MLVVDRDPLIKSEIEVFHHYYYYSLCSSCGYYTVRKTLHDRHSIEKIRSSAGILHLK